ncbi:MAG: hypothetical protein FD155_541 [Bacteroidetes bacterium]|nr:MAG: hypothetical protein FD155_541 [Bacteroidota bacterium]
MFANFNSMKKVSFNIATICFLCFYLLVACTKFEEEIDIADIPGPYVVSSYLYPGMDTVKVYVHQAYSLNAQIQTGLIIPVENAEVLIANAQSGKLRLMYNPNDSTYAIDGNALRITAGQQYTLSVAIADHPLIESAVVVPFPNENFGIIKTDSNTSQYVKDYYFKAFINDSAGIQNNYQLFGTAEIETVCQTDTAVEITTEMSMIFDYSPLISDQTRDGQTFHQNADLSVFDRFYPYQCHSTALSINLKLIHLEGFTYTYLKALEDFDIALGDPFAQYVIVPSNLTNAQGVFGAYAVVEKEILWSELSK